MDIETLISQLRQYSGHIEQAARSLELAIQVGGTRRRGRPRKLHVAVEQVPGSEPARPKALNVQKG